MRNWNKVNSIQEACAKCSVVHLLNFEILQTTHKKQQHLNAKFIGEKLKTRVWHFLFHYFHVICKISNFNMWTAKHLAQASCTELTLIQIRLHKGLGSIICSHLVGITKDHRGAELMLFMYFVNNKFNLPMFFLSV